MRQVRLPPEVQLPRWHCGAPHSMHRWLPRQELHASVGLCGHCCVAKDQAAGRGLTQPGRLQQVSATGCPAEWHWHVAMLCNLAIKKSGFIHGLITQDLRPLESVEAGRFGTLEIELYRNLAGSCTPGDTITCVGLVKVVRTEYAIGAALVHLRACIRKPFYATCFFCISCISNRYSV